MKINPFMPNAPVSPVMFIGRAQQLKVLVESLHQTKYSKPAHFMMTGERGIGKTSFLRFLKSIATATDHDNHQAVLINDSLLKLNFLVIEIDIEPETTKSVFLKRIQIAIQRELGETEKSREVLNNLWGFLCRTEVAGLKINNSEQDDNIEVLLDEFSYALAKTVSRVVNKEDSIFSASYDGILILIDEADNSSENLGIGLLLKTMLERLQKHGCENVMIGLAGLPELSQILKNSHPSSLRLFNAISIDKLTNNECHQVIDRCLEAAKDENKFKTEITSKAKKEMVHFSEGYPHFIQQFGYSCFDADNDNKIDLKDAKEGISSAIRLIGERYCRSDYNNIKSEDSREVLSIIADEENRWVLRKDIAYRYIGKKYSMDRAIKDLKEKDLIISKEGERGRYRIRHIAFAAWILLQHTSL